MEFNCVVLVAVAEDRSLLVGVDVSVCALGLLAEGDFRLAPSVNGGGPAVSTEGT
jgi:hypothetical protein